MVDISKTLISKSDQFNAVDLVGKIIVYKISKVIADIEKKDQPVSIFFENEKKCYRPSKGMRAIIAEKWSPETDLWIGKSLELYHEPKVVYAGAECGGIRINGMSHIDNDFKKRVVESKVLQINYKIRKLPEQLPQSPLKQAPANHSDIIDRYILQINNIDNLDEIEVWRSSKKYQWVKDNSPDDLPKIDEALQIKENEIKG